MVSPCYDTAAILSFGTAATYSSFGKFDLYTNVIHSFIILFPSKEHKIKNWITATKMEKVQLKARIPEMSSVIPSVQDKLEVSRPTYLKTKLGNLMPRETLGSKKILRTTSVNPKFWIPRNYLMKSFNVIIKMAFYIQLNALPTGVSKSLNMESISFPSKTVTESKWS